MLVKGKLCPTKHMDIAKRVDIFLHILGHHAKNHVIKFEFQRSGETVSIYFGNVLNAVLRLQGELFSKPQPIPEDSSDEKWKCFKSCLGAIDGTYIKVEVPVEDKPRYRNKKDKNGWQM